MNYLSFPIRQIYVNYMVYQRKGTHLHRKILSKKRGGGMVGELEKIEQLQSGKHEVRRKCVCLLRYPLYRGGDDS